MNEAELVDVALAVLAEVSPDARGWGRRPGRTRARPGGLRGAGRERRRPRLPGGPPPEGGSGTAAGRRPGFPVPSSLSRRLPGPVRLLLLPGGPAGL